MMKRFSCLLLGMTSIFISMYAQDYLISTPNTSLLIHATPGQTARIHYYGTRIEKDRIQQI